jgi:hypothetical protein
MLVLDGSQSVMTLSEAIRVAGQPELSLHMLDELRSRSESLPGLVGQAFVAVPSPPSTNVLITLEWSAPGEFTALPGVILLAGQTQATFSVTNLDDAIGDGDAQITLRASAPGYLPASITLWNADNEVCPLWSF